MSAAISRWPSTARKCSKHSSPPGYDMRYDRRDTYRSPLLRTASETFNREQPAELRALLKAKSYIHERDVNGNTCLHLLIGAAHPNETWVVYSLTALVRAGADPSQPNHFGVTTFDVACNAPPALGSFRRDLLLQALLERESDVVDNRLFRPTRLTVVYTRMRHEALFGDRSSHSDKELRNALLEELTDAAWARNLTSDRKLPETALERVLSTYGPDEPADADTVLRKALDYLELMCEGKKQIVRLCKQRLDKQSCIRLGGNLNLLQLAERANTAALLEFDWWRPVDVEDLFSSYVDSLIDQLEDIGPTSREAINDVESLIDLLQNAIPSYSALASPDLEQHELEGSSDRPESGRAFAPLMIDADTLTGGSCGSYSEWLVADQATVEDRERKESIVKTPVEFYSPEAEVE